MSRSAGEPMSIRLPAGVASYIRERTGRPVGEVLREMAVAYAAKLRAEELHEAAKVAKATTPTSRAQEEETTSHEPTGPVDA